MSETLWWATLTRNQLETAENILATSEQFAKKTLSLVSTHPGIDVANFAQSNITDNFIRKYFSTFSEGRLFFPPLLSLSPSLASLNFH